MRKKHIRTKTLNKKKFRLSRKAGLPPGTIIHIGNKSDAEVMLSAVFYNSESVEHKQLKEIAEFSEYLKKDGITWINITGIHKPEVIEAAGKIFGLNPFVLEDIANTTQRPKFDEFDEFIFFTLKNLKFDSVQNEILYEHINFILGENYVISFQEKDSGIFEQIRERIINGIGKARNKGADYLIFLLIDATVDNYYEVTENIEDNIESIEDNILANNTKNSLVEILKVKRELIVLLKSIFPLREAINKLQRSGNKLIADTSHIYFNSIYDHAVHIIESVESQRDILSGLMEIYMTNISNRMNSVMKVLTVIATIFMPLSFFAAVYGMNFKFFPEIEWKWGYLFFWCLCIMCVCVMLLYFRKKKWLK